MRPTSANPAIAYRAALILTRAVGSVEGFLLAWINEPSVVKISPSAGIPAASRQSTVGRASASYRLMDQPITRVAKANQ